MKQKTHAVDVLVILVLFVLFTATAVATVLIGIKIYGYSVNSMEDNYESRTMSSYLYEKIRQNDVDGAIGVAYFSEEMQAITLEEVYEDTSYVTYLYVYDGYLRELTLSEAEGGQEFNPNAGQRIIEANSLNIAPVEEKLLKVTYETSDGEKDSIYLTTRCESGGAYEY